MKDSGGVFNGTRASVRNIKELTVANSNTIGAMTWIWSVKLG